MPRLKNTKTGVIVNVSKERAKTLVGYEPADKKSDEKSDKK